MACCMDHRGPTNGSMSVGCQNRHNSAHSASTKKNSRSWYGASVAVLYATGLDARVFDVVTLFSLKKKAPYYICAPENVAPSAGTRLVGASGAVCEASHPSSEKLLTQSTLQHPAKIQQTACARRMLHAQKSISTSDDERSMLEA